MKRALLIASLIAGFASLAALPRAPAQEAQEVHPDSQRLDPETATMPTGELLDRLFGQLHQAKDEETAKLIEQAIWQVWSRSGSATADLLLAQAQKAMQARAFPAAIAILDTIIDRQPDFAEAWNKRATTYYLMRRFDQSLIDIERVLDLEPRHFGALAGRGMILQELGRDREALDAYRRALTIHPNMPGPKKAVEKLGSEVEKDI